MKIGIDIDGVLTNDDDYILDTATKFCFLNNINNYLEPYEYELRKKFHWDQEIRDNYRNQYYENYVINEMPRKYASEVIQKLKNDGNEIYIITSRRLSTNDNEDGLKMRNMIKEWLKKHHIVYDQIFFSKDKTKEIQELEIDVMIEDSPETIPCFVKYTHIFCYDARYNRELVCNNMTRVFSWYDIYMKLIERKKMKNKEKIQKSTCFK